MVALTVVGEVVLVRQFREAIRSPLLEIPAGVMDLEEERPETCAARELREETGYAAFSIEHLATIYTSPGFADERVAVFLAQAEHAGERGEVGVETVLLPFGEALETVRRGAITDAKTVAGLLLAADRLPGVTD